jgi:aspartyl/asparaginyl beta-hydroxylase (cupin superfamily)
MPEDDRRVRQIFEAAAQAFAAGRAADAERLLQQAETEAPNHPLVRGEIARRLLIAGDLEGGRVILEGAVRDEPGDASLWLNLAATLRGLKRPQEEMAALNKVLDLEPRNVRALLQVASLHEILGAPRAAAASFRTALQMIPPGFTPPPELGEVLQHARAAVAANDRALETFLDDRLSELRKRYADEPLARFDRCMDLILQKRAVYRPAPTFMYFPNLPAYEFHDRAEFPWLDRIEAATDDIRAELVELLADGPENLEPYVSVDGIPQDRWRELNKSRRWGVFFLWRGGEMIAENVARCPKTVAALEAWPKCELKGTAPSAVFSILDARTKIPPHTGVNNARLIVHLPLIVPPGCGFRVGAETREWEPGKAFVFDDTIEHEAWNNSDQPRAVLIFDIWNPQLSLAERELVSSLTAGVSEYYGTLPAYI